MKKITNKRLSMSYTRKVLLGTDSSLKSGIEKETIVKKKSNQYANFIKNGIKYTIFENKLEFQDGLSKDNHDYILVAKKIKKIKQKNYYLNSIKKYDIIQEVEKIVKSSEYDSKNIDKKYLEKFLEALINRIEKPEEKFIDYVKKTFGVNYDC
jgi:hypothetical protein